MMMTRSLIRAASVLCLVVALGLALTAKSDKRDCIDDDGCNLNVGSITAEVGTFFASPGWVQTHNVYGKDAVYAGPNDDSRLDENGLDTPGNISAVDVFVDDIDADEIDAYSITATYKSFKIDHPLDPANKVLNHWSIESDELKNLYDGIAVLDESGAAEVALPRWFRALNTEYRYQLTAIGGPAPGLFIAEELADGRFRIGGGTAGKKVSWQVTGVRKDPNALRNRKPVEEEKRGEDRGRYLDPEAFGKPSSERLGRTDRQGRPPSTPDPAVNRTPTISSAVTPATPNSRTSIGQFCTRALREGHRAAIPLGALGLLMGIGSITRRRRTR